MRQTETNARMIWMMMTEPMVKRLMCDFFDFLFVTVLLGVSEVFFLSSEAVFSGLFSGVVVFMSDGMRL